MPHYDYEVALYVLAVILIAVINMQSVFTFLPLKVRTASTNILHISQTFSDLLLSLYLILIITTTAIPHLDTLLSFSSVSSLASTAVISLDKLLSLACPFSYSNIVNSSSSVKTSALIWAFSLILNFPLLLTEIQHHKSKRTSKLAILIILIILLILSCCCHLYVIIVAHRHKKIIRRTAKSIQLTIKRLNSIQSRTRSHQNTPEHPTSMKSHTNSVESVFIYSKASSNHILVPQSDVIRSQPSKIRSPLSMPTISLIILLCGWAPFLVMNLYLLMSKQDLEKEEVWLQVGLMMPILVLSATKLHLEGKFKQKNIKNMLYKGRKRMEQKNIDQMIQVASVPVETLKTENFRNAVKYRRRLRKQNLKKAKQISLSQRKLQSDPVINEIKLCVTVPSPLLNQHKG